MSTLYFIVCMDCKNMTSIVNRSFHGRSITPGAKKKLPEFVMTHVDHKIRLISEYDELISEYDEMELTENE